MATKRPRKAELLERELASTSGTIADLKRIATSLNLMEDRYIARPAAELMVDRGDPAAAQIAAGLAMTPVLGRDPKGDRLRAAFKKALANEGIPAEVEEMARAFYGRRGPAQGANKPPARQDDWIGTTDTGGVISSIRKLFGGR